MLTDMEKRMLVFSAHAADYCTRAGGTILKYADKGWRIHVVCLTTGSHGESGGYWKANPNGTIEECSSVRKAESTEAAARLGATVEFLGWDDYPLEITEQRQRQITRMVLDFRPQVVLTHWTTDPTNPDHEKTSRAVVMACNASSQLGAFPNTPALRYPDIYFFEPTVPLPEMNSFSPDFYVDIDETVERKFNAIAAFTCQPHLGGYYKNIGHIRAMQYNVFCKRSVEQCEAFKRFIPYCGKELPLSQEESK